MWDRRPLSELVAWSSEPRSRASQAARIARNAGEALLTLVLGFPSGTSAAGRDDAVGDDDPDPLVDPAQREELIGRCEVTGRGSGMSGRYPSWNVVDVRWPNATFMPGTHTVELELAGTTITAAVPIGRRLGPRKAVNTRWEITVQGTGRELRLRGPWLILALLGTQNGWPEPT